MESTKTIKGMDEETWFKFKSLASENNLKMPEMFKVIVDDWRRSSTFWERILNYEKTISEEDAKVLLRKSKDLRAESGFR